MERLHRNEGKQVLRKCWKKRGFVLLMGVVLTAVQIFGNITLCRAAQLTQSDGAVQLLSPEPFPKILQDVSPDGKKLLLTTWVNWNRVPENLWIYDLETKDLRQLTFNAKWTGYGRFSPDGSKVIYMGSYVGSDAEAKDQIFTISTEGGNPNLVYSKLGPKDGIRNPCWSPDGKKILAAGILASKKLPWGLYLFDLEKGEWEFLLKSESGTLVGYPNFSPDGTKIAYVAGATGEKEKPNLYIFSLTDKKVSKLDTHGIVASVPAWSPDGKWIAFAGWIPGEGNYQFYIISADGLGEATQVTKRKAFNFVRWNPDGKKLFFTASSLELPARETVFSIDIPSSNSLK